jgi:hypothetical protein
MIKKRNYEELGLRLKLIHEVKGLKARLKNLNQPQLNQLPESRYLIFSTNFSVDILHFVKL